MVTNSAYTRDILVQNYPNGIENHYWSLARNYILSDTIKKHKLDSLTFLEIGCGRGVVTKFMIDNCIDYFGVDLSVGSPFSPTERTFMGTDFKQLKPDFKSKIDVILLLDVIEHIQNPELFLTEIRSNFPNAKWYIIAVPARREIWSNYDVTYGHYRRYTRKTLKTALESFGCRIHENRYLFHALYWPALILKLLRVSRKTKLKPPTGKGIFVHKTLARFFLFESRLRLSRLIGTSILSISKMR